MTNNRENLPDDVRRAMASARERNRRMTPEDRAAELARGRREGERFDLVPMRISCMGGGRPITDTEDCMKDPPGAPFTAPHDEDGKARWEDYSRGARDLADAARGVWHLVKVLSEAQDPRDAHYQAASAALARDEPPLQGEDLTDARRALAAAVVDKLPDLRRAVGMDGDPPTTESEAKPWEHDERLATHLEGFGKWGQLAAKRIRAETEERLYQEWLEFDPDPDAPEVKGPFRRGAMMPVWSPWYLWLGWVSYGHDTVKAWVISPMLKRFAAVLWHDVVKPRLEAERERERERLRKGHQAVTSDVLEDVTRLFERNTKTAATGPQLSLLDRFGIPVATFDPGLITSAPVADAARLGAILERLPRVMQSPYGPLGLAWTIREIQQQELQEIRNPQDIHVLGGNEALAQNIGAGGGRKIAVKVLEVFRAMAMARDFGYAGRGQLIALTMVPNAPGQRRETIVTGLPIIRRGWVYNIAGQHPAAVEARRLIPVVDLKLIPVDPRDQRADRTAPILLTALRTPAELRRHPTDMNQKHGAPIDPYAVARRSGLSAKEADRAIGVFLDGIGDRPPFLERLPGNLWTLADAHRGARDFLENAAEVAKEKARKATRRKRKK